MTDDSNSSDESRDDAQRDRQTCTHGQMTKGISNCSADATHTGGGYYPGAVCEDHAVDDSEPLDDDRDDKQELVTDGGVDLADVPTKDGYAGEMPDLEVGDKVTVSGSYSETDRTLTVVDCGKTAESENIEWSEDGGYTLEGYGTTYSLEQTTSLTGSWKRLLLVWDSCPEGEPVESIEVSDDE